MLKALHSAKGERPREVETEAEIARLHQAGEGCLWVDLEAPTDSERGLLDRVFKFHRLAIENCMAASNHPRIDPVKVLHTTPSHRPVRRVQC